MIAFVTGNFVHKSPAVVQVDVNGVGYELQISLHTYSKIQAAEKGTLLTWLHVKEDAHTLYGFSEAGEKAIFLLLISVNGVGTSTARMMLSSLTPEELTETIARGDVKTLEKVKGIGKKTAERIILELKDKVAKTTGNAITFTQFNNSLEQDALNALVALGIARNAAENAVKKATASAIPENLETIIKTALQLI